MVPVHVALNGITREADEGTAAHIFQVLIVAVFAFTWIPQRPMWATRVLAFQLWRYSPDGPVFMKQLCEFGGNIFKFSRGAPNKSPADAKSRGHLWAA